LSPREESPNTDRSLFLIFLLIEANDAAGLSTPTLPTAWFVMSSVNPKIIVCSPQSPAGQHLAIQELLEEREQDASAELADLADLLSDATLDDDYTAVELAA
jgi:hypothetical protein